MISPNGVTTDQGPTTPPAPAPNAQGAPAAQNGSGTANGPQITDAQDAPVEKLLDDIQQAANAVQADPNAPPRPTSLAEKEFINGDPRAWARSAGTELKDNAGKTVGKESTDTQKVSRVIDSGPLKGLLYAADASRVTTAIAAGVTDWDTWFTTTTNPNAQLVVSINFVYDPNLKTFSQGSRDAFEMKFVYGLVQMANTPGDSVTAKIAKTILLTTTNIKLERGATPQAYFPQLNNPKYGLKFDPTKIDTEFVGADGLRKFAAGDGALGDAFQAFATVVGHEFAHRYSKLILSDPSPANPTGTVLLIENMIRQELGLGPRLRYTQTDGIPFKPPYLDAMETPTMNPRDAQNPLRQSDEYGRLHAFVNKPAPPGLKMEYPGTGQAATLTEEQQGRKAAHDAIQKARQGDLTLAKKMCEEMERTQKNTAAFHALKRNGFVEEINRQLGNESFFKANRISIDKSRYEDLFTYDLMDLQ